MHYPVAREFLKRGIHVICDKPLTSTLADAKKLAKAAESSGALFVLTHNYTGYPMIRQARDMVQSGELGEDPAGAGRICRRTGCRKISRRPGRNRPAGAPILRDPASRRFDRRHRYACLQPGKLRLRSGTGSELCADLDSFVEGRQLDDNGHVLMRYEGGAKGMLWCKPGRAGQRERPEAAHLRREGRARMGAGGPELSLAHAARRAETAPHPRRRWGDGEAGQRVSRIPGGHPEGYLEGFATIYSEAAEAIAARRDGKPAPEGVTYPRMSKTGWQGVAFVAACVDSSRTRRRMAQVRKLQQTLTHGK
jgi:predicted dehydrogenase